MKSYYPAAILVLLALATGRATAATDARLAMQGYCPVCVMEMKQWVKGKPEFSSVYDGREYRFPDAKAKAAFDADPAKFVPALGGDCVVCLDHKGERVPGDVKFSARHKGRIYLFPAEGPKQEFMAAPEKFENADLALDGRCAVCLAMGHEVAGREEFAAYHQGMRYLFPSAKERDAFLANPEKYAVQQAGSAMSEPAEGKEFVSITGASGCAACSYGVHPIGDKNSLGLAVTADDGDVYIVEGAEEAYPEIFKQRFDKLSLRVEGDVIRRQGRYAWIEPASVQSVN